MSAIESTIIFIVLFSHGYTLFHNFSAGSYENRSWPSTFRVHSLESISESLILRWCKINKKVGKVITNVIPVITNQQGKLMLTDTSN